jgi:hypothetical protein
MERYLDCREKMESELDFTNRSTLDINKTLIDIGQSSLVHIKNFGLI